MMMMIMMMMLVLLLLFIEEILYIYREKNGSLNVKNSMEFLMRRANMNLCTMASAMNAEYNSLTILA